ncbi:alpha-L-fucosidase [Marinilongibacter aquaticus]|uniref:alpha-L-fucosidase n=1 Tax=Marinilongibacter aquaticus TaxID=2975157 RepID=UPI0021BD7A65|nr:alpha-L-fucosidase [Marinilongibacter aquaticus]UBM58933.1 alpha-L-fucosidase [Marinilongibacter aquaticus]
MKMLNLKGFILFLSAVLVWACQTPPKADPPKAVQPLPNADQVAWQKLETYAFVHFNMNTFSDREWGFGDEDPKMFNPSELDCNQWAKVCKESGLKGIIITAKHHDGFCLWPSKYTEHSIKNSPFRDGKGDLIKELSEACKAQGLKFGIYYSPWDRNHPDYGKPEYITYMRNQLTELLTNYGDIFEVWFDGANGGDGYYGGANETRKVDKLSYYDWENTYALVRKLQPHAMMFSDGGPDIRWVGNESGYAYKTTWSNLLRDSVYAGMPDYSQKYAEGQENGTHWVPAEVDVSVRPNWYYHTWDDDNVKTVAQLTDIYYESVGRNANLLFNFPVDRRGLIHEKDAENIVRWHEKIEKDFKENLIAEASLSASGSRGYGYEVDAVKDGDYDTYWTLEDGSPESSITVDFGEKTAFNRLLLQEYIPLGQRVKVFTVEAKNGEEWKEIANETTIGYKRILRLEDQEAEAIRINFKEAKDIPLINNIGVYLAPKLLIGPKVSRTKAGEVSFEKPELGLKLFYTLDGSAPTKESTMYTGPFSEPNKALLKAVSYDERTDKYSEEVQVQFEKSKSLWKILGGDEDMQKAVDGDPNTAMRAKSKTIVLDLGEELNLKGFKYAPNKGRQVHAAIKDYALYTSADQKNWENAAEGSFDNIRNNSIEQKVDFSPRKARYVKIVAKTILDDQPLPVIAEFGIITE